MNSRMLNEIANYSQGRFQLPATKRSCSIFFHSSPNIDSERVIMFFAYNYQPTHSLVHSFSFLPSTSSFDLSLATSSCSCSCSSPSASSPSPSPSPLSSLLTRGGWVSCRINSSPPAAAEADALDGELALESDRSVLAALADDGGRAGCWALSWASWRWRALTYSTHQSTTIQQRAEMTSSLQHLCGELVDAVLHEAAPAHEHNSKQ